MVRRTLTVVALILGGSLALVAQQGVKLPVNWKELPAPFATESARNNPTIVPRPAGAQLTTPAGFTVAPFLTGLNRPRYMILGPSNEIILSETARNAAVSVIRDGVKTPIIEKLDRPYGLALNDGWLYVAEPEAVKRYRYDAKTMRVVGEGQPIIAMEGMGTGHTTRTLMFSRDGKKLYMTVGSQSNIDQGEPALRAALHSYNPDGTGHQLVASGLRNAVGLRLYPDTDDVWVSVHERDGLGDDLAPDYVTKITPGGFYGWPIAYIGPHPEPRHKDIDQEKVKTTLYPDVLLGGHVGPLDIFFYTGKQFPEKYRGGMFVALHGSWNRAARQGYKIAFIPFKDRKPVAGPEDFVTGFMVAPDSKEVWGRPVGLLQMPDGSLLFTEDGGNAIWRVSFKGESKTSAGSARR